MSIFNIPKPLLEAVNSVILKEHELTRREIVSVDQKYRKEIANHKEATKQISGHLFSDGEDRLVIPLDAEEHPTKTAVEDHLHSNGFHSTNYRAALTKDRYNRDVTIGKALTRTGASKDLINQFAVHHKTIAEQPDTTSHLQVVISKHPHDVIGMSQGTDWGLRPDETHLADTRPNQSCMRFNTLQHEKHMQHELNAGTHIAWLTHKGDDEAKEPLSRITLRPFSKSTNINDGSLITKFGIQIPLDKSKGLVSMYDKFPNRYLGDDIPNGHKIAAAINHLHAMYGFDEGADSLNDVVFSHTSSTHHHLQFNNPSGATKSTLSNHLDNFTSYYYKHLGDIEIDDENHVARQSVPISNSMQKFHNKILVPGKTIYGKHVDAFKSSVKKWANKSFNQQPGVEYRANDNVYMDGDPTTTTK